MSSSPEDQAVLDFVGAMNRCFGFGQASGCAALVIHERDCDVMASAENVGNGFWLGLWLREDPSSLILWDASKSNTHHILAGCITSFFHELIESGKSEFDALGAVSHAVERFA